MPLVEQPCHAGPEAEGKGSQDVERGAGAKQMVEQPDGKVDVAPPVGHRLDLLQSEQVEESLNLLRGELKQQVA